MIYLDSSVVLAFLLAEDRKPNESVWSESLTSSKLIEYEIWTLLNGKRLALSHGEAAKDLLEHVSLVDLSPVVLARALEPFPIPVRTLDAIHLATLEFVRSRRIECALATFDRRMTAASDALGVPLARIE